MSRILIIGPSWVGDMVMAQSLFISLKNNEPNTKIDVLAPDWTRPLLERMPEVEASVPLPFSHGELALGKRLRMANSLKEKKYDQAILLPNSWKSALIPRFAKIPKRTGWLGEYRFGLLNDIRILDKKRLPKMVQRYVMLGYPKGHSIVDNIPSPKLSINSNTAQETLKKFNLNKNQGPILALCPGAEFGPAKRWPEEYYADLARIKLKEGWQVFLFGSKKDAISCLKIQDQTNHQCIDLSGKTSLGEAIDILSETSFVVCNDSGLMHIAAALDKPQVAVYGPTSPKFTPPLSEKARIVSLALPCSPCFKRTCPLKHQNCMKHLTPAHILEELKVLELQCAS